MVLLQAKPPQVAAVPPDGRLVGHHPAGPRAPSEPRDDRLATVLWIGPVQLDLVSSRARGEEEKFDGVLGSMLMGVLRRVAELDRCHSTLAALPRYRDRWKDWVWMAFVSMSGGNTIVIFQTTVRLTFVPPHPHILLRCFRFLSVRRTSLPVPDPCSWVLLCGLPPCLVNNEVVAPLFLRTSTYE